MPNNSSFTNRVPTHSWFLRVSDRATHRGKVTGSACIMRMLSRLTAVKTVSQRRFQGLLCFQVGNYISAIYPPELQLTDTSTSSTEVCYLDTHIKTGGTNTPFHISIYDKRDDFTFRIVNFPHMDSNIPANPAYGVYISQLVRYARIICTSKVDFMNRLRGLSLRLRQQGFLNQSTSVNIY